MKKFTKLVGVVLAVGLCVAVTACGKQQDSQENATYPTIGTKAEGAFDILLKNNIGQDITALSVKLDTEEQYPENMLASDFILKNGETAQWFYMPTETEPVQESETEFLLNPLYQVQVTAADNSVYEISSFGFEDIDKEAELCLEDDVLFIQYTSKESGSVVSTKEQEQAAKAQKAEMEKAEAERVAAEQAEAERIAAEKAEAEKAAAQKEKMEKAAAQKAQPQQPVSQQPAPKQTPVEEIPQQSTEGCLTEGGGPVFND